MAKDINKNSFDEATKLKLTIFGECFKEWLPVFLHNRYTQSVYIYDFFAGSGTDAEGHNGSPLILLTEAKDPIFLFTSGANTQVIALEDKYRIFGEALSVAIGNALDKFGREAGLGFPCGPKIEELAKKGKYVKLPYVVKGMDVEFSGIVTKAISLIDKEKLEDLCFSLQETCFAMLAEVSERAMAHCEKEELLLIGGVAANKRLVEMLEIMCKERNAKFYYVPIGYSGDNAVMIGWQGILEFKAGRVDDLDVDFNPKWRVDEVEVIW